MWFDLDKISETGAEWYVDCGDVVEIETRCRILIWRTFGRIQWYCHPRATCYTAGCCHLANSMSWLQSYMSHCRVMPPGEFNGMSSQSHVSHCRVLPATWWIHCHDSRATCHIAGCKNKFIRHIENRSSTYFFLFLMQFRLWRAAAFVSSPIHLFESQWRPAITIRLINRPAIRLILLL